MSDTPAHVPPRPGKRLQFQLRGKQMNRIEAVSDVVFGFALTLLVVSLQVPRTYADLIDTMRSFPAFALAFAALMAVWVRHYYFFRCYGLDDPVTIALNTLLLFVVLFYVYPLKFLCDVWLAPLTGMSMRITNPQGGMRLVMAYGDTRGLQLIFGSGFTAVYLVFAAMYWHAWRMREALHLSTFEIAHTRTSVVIEILNGGVGLLSMLVACVLKPDQAYAAYVFFLVFFVSLLRRHRRAHETLAAPAVNLRVASCVLPYF
jgi:hypothetical protein